MPHLEALAPEVLLAPTANVDPTKAPAVEPEAPTKEVGTQSQYRESETQTTPYTPDVILPQDGRVLEVQILEGLTFTNGLPAGKKQIEMIEHARKKKALEEALPPGTDEASLTIRKILMEEQEMRDFIFGKRRWTVLMRFDWRRCDKQSPSVTRATSSSPSSASKH